MLFFGLFILIVAGICADQDQFSIPYDLDGIPTAAEGIPNSKRTKSGFYMEGDKFSYDLFHKYKALHAYFVMDESVNQITCEFEVKSNKRQFLLIFFPENRAILELYFWPADDDNWRTLRAFSYFNGKEVYKPLGRVQDGKFTLIINNDGTIRSGTDLSRLFENFKSFNYTKFIDGFKLIEFRMILDNPIDQPVNFRIDPGKIAFKLPPTKNPYDEIQETTNMMVVVAVLSGAAILAILPIVLFFKELILMLFKKND
uniref:Uncharacterized protein n=1 Tax=Panagrolaimus sp. JU765 TaxID=591449 RepID=A0AC34R671_9BILA